MKTQLIALCAVTATLLAAPIGAASLDRCVGKEVRAHYDDVSARVWLGGRVSPKTAGSRTTWTLERVIPGGALFDAGAKAGDVIEAIDDHDLLPAPPMPTVLFVGQLLPSTAERSVTIRFQQQEREITVMPRRARPSVFYEVFGVTLLSRAGWEIDDATVSPPQITKNSDCLSEEIGRRVSSLRGSPWLGTGRTRLLWADGSSHWELSDIVPGGPLDIASIRDGDSVIGLDGIDLTKLDGPVASPLMRRTVGGWKPGQAIALRIRRGDSEFDTTLTVEEARGHRLASRLATLLLREAGLPYAEEFYASGAPEAARNQPLLSERTP